MAKEIVIIGAGFAGVAAARKLGKEFKRDESVNITLIDRHSYLTYMTELHEVAGGRIEPDAIKYDLQRIFHRLKNVKLVTDSVKKVDYTNKVIHAEHGDYNFDYVIVAVGGAANDFNTPGVKEYGFTLWSMEDSERVREHIIDCVYKAAREHDEAKRRSLLSFLVCGAGFTGVEMIGEIIEWIPKLVEEHKLNMNEVSYHLVEAAPSILNTVSEVEQERALKYMKEHDIQISLGDAIVKVEADHIELKSGKMIPTYTCIWTAGVRANRDVDASTLNHGRANRLVVNEYMQAEGYDNVYVAGDVMHYEDPNNDGMPVPQIVQAAEQTGDTAAHNIIADIKGGEKEAYNGSYSGNMVSIGSRYSVSLLNNKYHLQGFWSNLVKHGANIIYFLSIGSFYYAWTYVRHEFFKIEDGRNMFGAHTSNHGNLLWSVPLRIFYGAMWLVEGLKKTFGAFGAQSWFGDEIVLPFPWLQETTSGASEVVTEATNTAAAADPIFSLNYVYGEEPMLVFEEMPGWFASLMEFLVPNQEVALFMQKVMSLAELAIGILLIIGLFTWLVNAATIVLVAMFCLSGMFLWVNMWFVPVAIALMNGSGRSFGLDYYVMPWLGRKLDRWIWGQPKHIYAEHKS